MGEFWSINSHFLALNVPWLKRNHFFSDFIPFLFFHTAADKYVDRVELIGAVRARPKWNNAVCMETTSAARDQCAHHLFKQL